jgi:NTE family protein
VGRSPSSFSLRLVLCIFLLAFLSCQQKTIKPQEVFAPKPAPRPVKVALVLGAGASRGFAHVGVLKVLETNRIPIDMIVGTSVGSFVGCLYAFGYKAFDLQRMALGVEKSDIAEFSIPDNGFLKNDRLEDFVNKKINNAPLERARIPFYAVATELQTGREVVFGKGNTGMAVRASCSIPGIFRPTRIGNSLYVDGGVVSPVAVDAARRYGADVVIAVDISADMNGAPPEGMIDTMLQSVNIMYSKLASVQLARADVVIRPRVGYIHSADFTKRDEAIMEGEKAAIEALPAIKTAIEKAAAAVH